MTAVAGTRPLPELEEERDFLLRSLDDLEAELAAGDLEEDQYRDLKEDYTARAAAVLRAIDAARASTDASCREVGPPGGPTSRHEASWGRRARPVVIGLAVVAFAVGAGVLVARSAGERLPGDPATGSITPTGADTEVPRDLARARQLMSETRTWVDAIKLYDEILARHPRQPEALAYRGWLVRLVGRQAGNPQLLDKGLEYLDRAVAADPEYPDAHFFRGMVLYEDKGQPAAAVAEFRAFLASNPPQPMARLVEDVLRRAEADAAARPAPQTPAPPPPSAP